ncbi:MAG: lipopolysaccharide transport periplasmic protein LptA [Candidatus Thiodiazotropha sp. (ex Lucinoma aequizonata)]|nr:lipopolysaccharide transport periplasmic protein LptA [Candidatus Thiodiazotropha sp. (ex Lucinoma aequizonata)]MCU7889853.1 lipopolysaccharide transport periplasmic protein LptA [Candidatus Thiodiazotropha sp. (ex Lucinoma aequizonata)]MCU7896413.1 lipopolysaccharide transport periplasmic protein LptA [Candidatus Thiodiazotropha sp. (ex Lucinoma aequizonata)]MCU7897308.1 lipopolysaccharide transport periplasmic protein LptA [Candidatus Thiodiazotropha sp. (ex Lucinoma aequizonata)]MCU790132
MILIRNIIGLVSVFLLYFESYQVFALSSDSDQPMHLEADSLSVDEATGVIFYEGNVEISQGSLKLWADRLWVFRRQGKTEKLVSEGMPTYFRQLMDDGEEEVRGEARRMELYVDRDELLLIDEALLEQGRNQFRNDRIIYNRTKAMVKAGSSAQGKQRVQVVIEPNQKTAP